MIGRNGLDGNLWTKRRWTKMNWTKSRYTKSTISQKLKIAKKKLMNSKIPFRTLRIFWEDSFFFFRVYQHSWATISRKLKIGKLILHSFQNIARYFGLKTTNYFFRHQRFDRALSWDMVTRCNTCRQKFNTTKRCFISDTLPHLTTRVKGK